MEKMGRQEIEAAAQRILGYLQDRDEAPILAMKDDLRNSELHFYMGLGDLILRRQVALRENHGVFRATKSPHGSRTA